MNSASSVIRSIHSSFFEDSVKKCSFLHCVVKSLRKRQLTSTNKADKSLFPDNFYTFDPVADACLRFFGRLVGCGRSSSVSLANYLKDLLVSQGIEPNPGPNSRALSSCNRNLLLISQNCRGLIDPVKFISLLRKAYDKPNSPRILCLQETHQLNRFALDNHFHGSAVVDNGDRDSRGTAILVPAQFDICMSRVSGNGRWSLAAIKDRLSDPGDANPVTVIASIYAPNCHRASVPFFEQFFDSLDEFVDDVASQHNWPQIIIAGDFNFVLRPDSDSLNRQSTQAERTLAALVEGHLDDRQLVDSTSQNQQSQQRHELFTWRRGNCCSRLDYVFVSTGLSSRITHVKTEWYSFGSNYDHASVSVEFQNKVGIPRGRSFPKLFKSDISSSRSIAWLVDQIQAAKAQIPVHWNPHQIHEFLKMSLRSKTLELRTMNRRQYSSKALTERINSLLQQPNQASMQEADQLKLELLQAEEAEAEELRLRAGIKWREEGERSSKYFLSRLKTRELARELHSLVDVNGDIVSSLKGVLQHVTSFYTKLYEAVVSSEPNAGSFFEHCPTLDPLQQQQLSNPLTLDELRETLKSCRDSAPGIDGIPYSFYVTFGDILLPSLLDSWNHALLTGQLAPSHLQSCITLLPKKDKDLKLIQNWRPISLSSCDLKIITKSYARRLSSILPDILVESQAAYVPGRDINFNSRLLRTAQSFALRQNKDYCVVSLDARKAFDSVSHNYLEQVMEAYQFPREFIKIFRTLYANNYASVQVNGHLSTHIQLNRGVKQGDALSCGLFVLAIDPLLRNIAANDRIKGLSIPTDGQESIEIKVLAYADDVAVVCKNRDLQPIFTEYERLSKISGLELNAEKTEVLNLIVSNNNLSRIRYQDLIFTLARVDAIRICGLSLSNIPELDYQRNVLDAISRMEGIISSWRKRTLTLNGRMLAAKTFVLSQIVFQAQVVTIATKEIKKIERLIYSFVNGAKSLYGPERIARRRLKATKEQGGINGVDVDSFIKAIQVRQFNKALHKHRILGTLQLSHRGCNDDLSSSVMSFLRAHYRSTLNSGILDLQQITQVSGIPL